MALVGTFWERYEVCAYFWGYRYIYGLFDNEKGEYVEGLENLNQEMELLTIRYSLGDGSYIIDLQNGMEDYLESFYIQDGKSYPVSQFVLDILEGGYYTEVIQYSTCIAPSPLRGL